MVPKVRRVQADDTSLNEPGFVVELLGPAAVGKSSLIEALTEHDERFVVGVDLRRRRIGHILYFSGNVLLLLPMILRQLRQDRFFTWEEIKMLVYLSGWHRLVRRQTRKGSIVLMENNGVFKLIRLHAFGPDNMQSQSFDRWWANMLQKWGNIVDTAIWLDAPDEVLLERVHERGRWHRVMAKSQEETTEFFARYRNSYEQIISLLVADYGMKLIRLDTHKESLDHMRDWVLDTYELGQSNSFSPNAAEVDTREIQPSSLETSG